MGLGGDVTCGLLAGDEIAHTTQANGKAYRQSSAFMAIQPQTRTDGSLV
jgi:hypothetical protein